MAYPTMWQVAREMTGKDAVWFYFDHLRLYRSPITVTWGYEVDIVCRSRIAEINQRIDEMANKKTTERPTETTKAVWGGYKNLTLTDKQLADFDKMVLTGTYAPLDCLSHLLGVGKVSLSYANGSFSCTVTAVYDGKSWALSAFSDSSPEAIQMLDYKIFIYPNWLEDDSVSKRSRG